MEDNLVNSHAITVITIMTMSPLQESLNAITMLLPSASLLATIQQQQQLNNNANHITIAQKLLLIGTLAHMPVAFAYHMGVALGLFRNRLDNTLRRMDQGIQHVVCVAFSLALSGSVAFAALNLAVNIHFIQQLASKNDGKRWIPVAACTFLYTLPMLWRRDIENYAVAMVSIALGGSAAFIVPSINNMGMILFQGWGHCFFHCMLAIFARALGKSAAQILTIGII